MHPHQGPFGEERTEARESPLVDFGKKLADRLPRAAVVTLARDEDQDRHEAIEAIAARQDPHPRTLVEIQDLDRKPIERIFVDLEQFVPRVALQHIDERLAGMAVGIKS